MSSDVPADLIATANLQQGGRHAAKIASNSAFGGDCPGCHCRQQLTGHCGYLCIRGRL